MRLAATRVSLGNEGAGPAQIAGKSWMNLGVMGPGQSKIAELG